MLAAGYDIFLSYNRADAAAADRLRARLDQDAGLKAFLDRYSLPGGKPWQPELEGRSGELPRAGSPAWPRRYRRLAAPRDPARPRPADSGREDRDPVPGHSRPAARPAARRRPAWHLPGAQHLGRPAHRPRRARAPAAPVAAAQGRAIDGLTRDLATLRPYRGLLPFREQDAGLFFGRGRFVAELTAKVGNARPPTWSPCSAAPAAASPQPR